METQEAKFLQAMFSFLTQRRKAKEPANKALH
jgi:hypothetical protein